MTIDEASRIVAEKLTIATGRVRAVLALLDEGSTIPFIARYRKEVTGALDEVQITAIRDTWEKILELAKRRETVLSSIAEQGKLSPELEKAITAAATLAELEDLYLPYRPKRRTRASIAHERGLSPFADGLLTAAIADPYKTAESFVDPEKGLNTVEDALQGARDIIAERISELAPQRAELRELFAQQAGLVSTVARGKSEDPEAAQFRDYFDYGEALKKIPSHRILALFRGESAKALSIKLDYPVDNAKAILERAVIAPLSKKGLTSKTREQLQEAVADGLDRLIAPSLETELRAKLKEEADVTAIGVFAENLREVLMSAPLGPVATLALDPGFRTGCKIAVLNHAGDFQASDTIYPLEPKNQTEEAATKIRALISRFKIGAVAIGNGTGGREAMAFLSSLKIPEVRIAMVNESGASIYSASEVARDEFPDLDLTIRGAISIGRRLMDPLAELVKLDPKSIGVGQYQHDVDQKALKRCLDETVSSCVNAVGVDLNTASAALLRYVSGLSDKSAKSIIAFRTKKGSIGNRNQLLEVTGLGPKTFEQAAGFLRIRNGSEVLDQSAVHPESYDLVKSMARDAGLEVAAIIGNLEALKTLTAKADAYKRPGQGTNVRDILKELEKPGRDPRAAFETFTFDEGIKDIADVKEGMRLPGVVTNVTAFGAFIDIGVHEQGLAHISQLSNNFVRDPHSVVKPGQKVMATVLSVDMQRKRISLSLKGNT